MGDGARSTRQEDRTRVAVIGVGGTGCALVPLLAPMAIKGITLIDGDTVEAGNLVRQLLFAPSDVGTAKVLAAIQRMRPVSPSLAWIPEFRFVDASNCADLIRDHDVVADCTDDLVARALIAATCGALGIPLVSGAVHGMQVQVTTISPRKGSAEGLRAIFPERFAEEQEGCDMQAVPATVTTIAATLMAMRVEDLLKGGHGHAGMMDLVDTQNGRWMRIMGPSAGEIMDTPIKPGHHA